MTARDRCKACVMNKRLRCNTQVKALADKHVRALSGGHFHAAAVCAGGAAYAWGRCCSPCMSINEARVCVSILGSLGQDLTVLVRGSINV